MTTGTAGRPGMPGWMDADTGGRATTTTVRPSAPQPPNVPPAAIVEPDDEQLLPPKAVPLAGELSSDIALLRVSGVPAWGDGFTRFRLTFHFRGATHESRDEDVDQQRVPGLGLADIIERATWVDDYRQVRGWWKEMSQLLRWMRELRASHSVRLVVWDNTPFQIPWELMYLQDADNEARSVWLSSVVEIARWSSLLQGSQAAYDAEELAIRGGLLLLEMLDPKTRNEGVARMAERLGYEALRDSGDWLSELARKDPRLALMILHCHGENAYDANRFTIAGLPMNDLDSPLMPGLDGSRPVVVLNACNTAKVVPVGANVSRATRSFVEVFLHKGASAVIATVGEVSLDQTHEFLRWLLDGTAVDCRLSGLLLAWRQYHVQRVIGRSPSDPRVPGRIEDFFHAFLYVYFGHPDSLLRVDRGGAD